MNELRLFISSTFRDLQEEREHLVKKIFPEIRALCRERGIRFTEVDLRWGLTDEQLALGQVIRTCLDAVEGCRPYFIGITGDRYGFIPSSLDVRKDPQLLERYPWIEEAAVDGMSISEMEAQYAVLRKDEGGRMKDEAGFARFYFRRQRESLDDAAADNDERTRLEAYQQRIRNCGVHVTEFSDSASLGELIYDDLIAIIERDFADARPPTPLEQERIRHEAFSLSRRRAYIPNPAYLSHLNDHVASADPPLVVYAESGSGKSSLFAYWAEQYRRKHPDAHVIEHYVGIGATAMEHYGIIRHLCMEIKERFACGEEIPTEPEKLETALGQWLGYADHVLRGAMPREGGATTHAVEGDSTEADLADSSFIPQPSSLIIILDGLNQLQGEALKLRWIPDVIPPSIRLILSSTVEGTLVEMRKRGWSQFGMQALTEIERQTIIVHYLADFRKSLNPEQSARIAGDYKCGHPLFLKTMLEELRLLGRHDELDSTITHYLETTGTEDLFQRVLERIEGDFNQRAVRDVMSLLAASRDGLDERELSEVSGIARLQIATMTAGLDYHLVRKEGQLTFFHDYLRRAVDKRYLDDERERRALHRKLASYFQHSVDAFITAARPVSIRAASELAYHLYAADAHDRLVECLSSMPVFLALYAGKTAYELLRYWASIGEGVDVAGQYHRSLAHWAIEDPDERSRGIAQVSRLLEQLGRWTEVIDLERERLATAIARSQTAVEGDSRRRIGVALYLRSEYHEAREELAKALDLFAALGDRRNLARTIGNIGVVHKRCGEYDQAIECYQHQLLIAEELDDRGGVANAIGNMGVVYHSRGEYDRAMQCLERQFRVAEMLGDLRDVSVAIAGMGVVSYMRGEYDRAVEFYERGLRISEELGDRSAVSLAIGNMGAVYCQRGEYDRAMECYERQLSITEELDDRNGVSMAIGNMGVVASRRGDYARALGFYERQLSIAEELGDRSGVAQAVGNIGSAHSNLGEFHCAMEYYDRQLHITRELGDHRGVALAIGNIGIVHERRGEYALAMEAYLRALREHRALGVRHYMTYWLEGIARLLLDVRDRVLIPDLLPDRPLDVISTEARSAALQRARADAEECLRISRALKKRDTLFASQVLLARIDAEERKHGDAMKEYARLLEEADDDISRSEVHYWRWRLGREMHWREQAEQDRVAALQHYRRLYELRPNAAYGMRIEELTSETTPVGDDGEEEMNSAL